VVVLVGRRGKGEKSPVGREIGEVEIAASGGHAGVVFVEDGRDLLGCQVIAVDGTPCPAHPEAPYAVVGEIRLTAAERLSFRDALGRWVVGGELGGPRRRVGLGRVEKPADFGLPPRQQKARRARDEVERAGIPLPVEVEERSTLLPDDRARPHARSLDDLSEPGTVGANEIEVAGGPGGVGAGGVAEERNLFAVRRGYRSEVVRLPDDEPLAEAAQLAPAVLPSRLGIPVLTDDGDPSEYKESDNAENRSPLRPAHG